MTVEATEPVALDVLYSLVLENGKLWGQEAAEFQIDDAEAIFDTSGPPWHFLTRPRGGSKTTDVAGVSLSWLATEATPGSRGYVVATSEEQASELIDAASGFVNRTEILKGYIGVEATSLYAANGATVRVMTADGSSAWGKGRDTGLIILDEFAQWPETRKSRRVWTAMLSSTQKTPGLRLIILTSAGEPAHFSYDVLREAREGTYASQWHVSETPGPVPWVSQAALDAQRPHLTESEFARLHLNQWTEEEDRLVSADDLREACVLDGDLPPKAGVRYIITVDLGVKIDPTVVVVSHVEPIENEPRAKRVVVDHLKRWVPTRKQPVRLAQVEEYLGQISRLYHRAPIHGDPSQFHEMRQNLSAQGINAKEFKFTPTSVGELGSALVLALRNHQLWLPDREDLREELLHVRLKESSPGSYRLDHDPKRHDDQAVTIGMAVHLLLGKRLGTSGFIAFMKSQIERRPTDQTAVQVDRAVRRRKAPRARGRRCEHRWRGSTCVFCGAEH